MKPPVWQVGMAEYREVGLSAGSPRIWPDFPAKIESGIGTGPPDSSNARLTPGFTDEKYNIGL